MSTLTVLTCTDCGHTTLPTTPALADYAFRRHSCDTTRMRAARAQRRLDRLALSGPEQPCTHGVRHLHGTYVCYVIDRCRCRPCRDANNIYERARTRRQMYGQAAYVPASPARAHVAELQAAGMGWKRIAIHAGIHTSVMWKLLYGDTTRNMGPSKRIRAATETKILAVTLDLGAATSVPGAGTRRRLQGLVAIGWSQSKLATRLGMLPSNFGRLIHGAGTGDVHVSTVQAVAQLYAQLWDQEPPRGDRRNRIAYSRSVRYAAEAGWVNDPHARPDVGKFWLADVDWLTSRGLTLDEVAARLGVGRSVVDQACRRGRRFDLLERMARNRAEGKAA